MPRKMHRDSSQASLTKSRSRPQAKNSRKYSYNDRSRTIAALITIEKHVRQAISLCHRTENDDNSPKSRSIIALCGKIDHFRPRAIETVTTHYLHLFLKLYTPTLFHVNRLSELRLAQQIHQPNKNLHQPPVRRAYSSPRQRPANPSPAMPNNTATQTGRRKKIICEVTKRHRQTKHQLSARYATLLRCIVVIFP